LRFAGSGAVAAGINFRRRRSTTTPREILEEDRARERISILYFGIYFLSAPDFSAEEKCD